MGNQMNICIAVAGMGGLVFGYDLGVIIGALPQIVKEYSLSSLEEGTVVGMASVGQLFGALMGGYLADRKGRLVTMQLEAIMFCCGTLVMVLFTSLVPLLVGRFIIGIAFALSMVSNVAWISEISTSEKRGSAISIYEFCVTTGVLLALLMSAIFSWRNAFWITVPLAILHLIGSMNVPESPIWLISANRRSEAEQVITKLGGTTSDLVQCTISSGIGESESLSVWKTPIIVIIIIQCLGLLTGGINIRIYSERIYEEVGIPDQTISILAIILGITKVLSTIAAVVFLDKLGRRIFYMMGVTLLAISNILIAIGGAVPGCYNAEGCTETHCQLVDNNCPSMCGKCPTYAAVFVVVGCTMGFSAYQLSFGPVNFAVGSELFPTHIRARLLGGQIVTQGLLQLATASVFPVFKSSAGLSSPMLFHSLCCALGLVFFTFFFVETSKKDPYQILNELDLLWGRSQSITSDPVSSPYVSDEVAVD